MLFESAIDQFGRYEAECAGCESVEFVGDLGLCAACSAECERDLIRMRDWEYAASACGLTAPQRDTLRRAVIRQFGERNELLSPDSDTVRPRKRPRSGSS